MTKVSSFLVFAIGIFLLVATFYSLGARYIDSRRTVEIEQVLPKSELTPLRLASAVDLHRQLDEAYNKEGLDGVRAFVAGEFVPGRRLLLRSNYPNAPDREFLIIDHEVRRCSRDGGALMDKSPVLTRVAVGSQAAKQSVLQTWSRTEASQPYYLTLWCLEDRPNR